MLACTLRFRGMTKNGFRLAYTTLGGAPGHCPMGILCVCPKASGGMFITKGMRRSMRIVSVNCSLDEALRRCGHEVFSVSLQGGLHALRAVQGLEAFTPDVIVQQEHLGYAVLLSDVPSFSCVKAFWSVDTHINMYWHRYYGRLFDVFFTPHKAFCAEAPPHWQHPNTCRLPAAGFVYPWKGHAERSQSLSFVGRMTARRPSRKAFVEFLQQRYCLQVQEDISYAQMLQIYADTCVLPNETIAFETNFRLLEGASCGCCVLSPAIGEDQNVLLEPGREVLVYADALECMDLADFCLRKPRIAENIGQMAQQRILADHLPQHRAAQLVQAVQDAPSVALKGQQAQEYLWCSLAELELTDENSGVLDPDLWDAECGNSLPVKALQVRRAQQVHDLAHAAAVVREALQTLFAAPNVLPRTRLGALANTVQNHAQGISADTSIGAAVLKTDAAILAEAVTVLGLACLRGGEDALARQCWHAFQHWHVQRQDGGKILPAGGQIGAEPIAVAAKGTSPLPDVALPALAMEWAGQLYPAGQHWYQALEMLSFVSEQDPLDGAWARAWLKLGPVVRHFPLLALSARARLSLNEADNPLLCAAYVAENIRAFRVQEAQDEVRDFIHRVAGSPTEAVFWQALQAGCKNISRLSVALQPFSSS